MIFISAFFKRSWSLSINIEAILENFRISFILIFLYIYSFIFLYNYNLLTINIIKNLNGKNNQNNNKSKIWKNSGKSENIDHLKMKLDKIYGMFK